MSDGTIKGRALDDGQRVDEGADVGVTVGVLLGEADVADVGDLDGADFGATVGVAPREIDGIDVLTTVGEVLGVTSINIGGIVSC